jgi:hypothetical protein
MTLTISLPDDSEFNKMMAIAKSAAESKLFKDGANVQANFMRMLAARELGLPLTFALCGGIHVFDGKIEIAAKTLAAMIRSNGHTFEEIESTDKICTLRGVRKNGESLVVSYTIEEAIKAKLTSKVNWQNYAKDMLWNRCVSRLSRRMFSDVVGMAYVEGEVIEMKPEDVTVTDSSAPVAPPAEPVAPPLPPPAEPRISAEQAAILGNELQDCPEEFRNKLRDLCKQHLGSEVFTNLPEGQFPNLLKRIKANQVKPQTIEMEEVQNETA